jgi:hypothetical protein
VGSRFPGAPRPTDSVARMEWRTVLGTWNPVVAGALLGVFAGWIGTTLMLALSSGGFGSATPVFGLVIGAPVGASVGALVGFVVPRLGRESGRAAPTED